MHWTRLRAAVLAAALLLALLPATRALAVTQAELHAQRLSVMAGPSPYGWNLVGIRKDLYTDKQTDLFITAGLGAILAGAGGAIYTGGPNADGFVASVVLGVLGIEGGFSYQWKVNPTDFIHFGVHVGSNWVWDEHLLPVVAWEHRL
jgi:hypothetical protein